MKRGFTLIELIVSLGILAVVLTVGINIFMQVIQTTNQAALQNDLRQNANSTMELIGRKVKSGACLEISGGNGLTIYSAKASTTTCDHTVYPIESFSIVKPNDTYSAIQVTKYTNDVQNTSTLITPANINVDSFSVSGTLELVQVVLTLSRYPLPSNVSLQQSLTQTQQFSLRNYNN